jgi:hypothetical protein
MASRFRPLASKATIGASRRQQAEGPFRTRQELLALIKHARQVRA